MIPGRDYSGHRRQFSPTDSLKIIPTPPPSTVRVGGGGGPKEAPILPPTESKKVELSAADRAWIIHRMEKIPSSARTASENKLLRKVI